MRVKYTQLIIFSIQQFVHIAIAYGVNGSVRNDRCILTVLVKIETTTMENTEDLYFIEGCHSINQIIIRVCWTII